MPAAEICEANKVYEVRVVARVSLLYMVIGGHNLLKTCVSAFIYLLKYLSISQATSN